MPKRTDINVGERVYVLTRSVEKFLSETNLGMYYYNYKSLFLIGKVHKIKPKNVSVDIDNKIQDYPHGCVYNQTQFDDLCFVCENGPKIVKRVQELVETRERGADKLRIINAMLRR